LSDFKARLFDLVHRAGQEGISREALRWRTGKRSLTTISSHINQINHEIKASGWQIKSTRRFSPVFRLEQIARRTR